MKAEGLRRVMHVGSAAALLALPLGSWGLLRTCVVSASVLFLALDLIRRSSLTMGSFVRKVLPVYRDSEDRRLSGATWLGVGYTLATLLPPPAPVAGILVCAVADPTASLVGAWGRSAGRKSLRGSLAALAAAAVVLALLALPVTTVVVGALVAASLERWSGPVNDNLTVPPATALVVWLIA